MKLHILLFVLIQIKHNFAFNNQWPNDRFGLREYNLHLSSVNITKICNGTDVHLKRCIWKCCPEGEVMGVYKSCEKSNVKLNNIQVYDFQHKTNKSISSVFKLVPHLLNDSIFAKNSLWWFRKTHFRMDTQLLLKIPNVYSRWKKIEVNHYCVDMKINGTHAVPVFMVEYGMEHRKPVSETKKWGLMVSAISVSVVLLVYAILPQLKNFNGILLMFNFFCLIVTFVSNIILDMNLNLRMSEMLFTTFFHYFFKMSTYCWTNVMFYQILTSREPDPDESMSRHDILKRCGYAFGLPLFLTITVATVELTDMTDTPSFVTPQIQNKGNFSFQEIESVYYLYIPIFIILSFNWIVCFIKVVQFCNSPYRLAGVLRNNEPQPLNRPMQILKLLNVLTLYALLEMLYVVCSLRANDYFSIYSICVGPLIVVIFVWNQNVRLLLAQKLPMFKKTASTSNLSTFFHRGDEDTKEQVDLPHVRS